MQLLLVGFLSISIFFLFLLTESLELFGEQSSILVIYPLGLLWTLIFTELFNIQPQLWWFIPIILTYFIGAILTFSTDRGKRFEQWIRKDAIKHRLEAELGLIAFMIESILISIILIVPILFLASLQVGALTLSGLLSSIGLVEFAEYLTQSRETFYLVVRVIVGLGLLIAFLMGRSTANHIAGSKLFTKDTRPIDGVVLGVYHALAPGIGSMLSLFLFACTVILLIYLGQGESAFFFSILSATSLIWLAISIFSLLMIIHALFVGGFPGGYRSIIMAKQGNYRIDELLSRAREFAAHQDSFSREELERLAQELERLAQEIERYPNVINRPIS